MTGETVILVIDGYGLRVSAPVQDKNPAVQWLETQFTARWYTQAFWDGELTPGPYSVRPMIELIDQITDAADDDHGPMVISGTDYSDPERWWL